MASHRLLEILEKKTFFKLLQGVFVEIGSSREEDLRKSSTFYLKKKCKKHGITFFSVDFSKTSYQKAKTIVRENAVQMDGKKFLLKFRKYSKKPISLLYLDNFDIVYNSKHKKSLLKRVGDAYKRNKEKITNLRSAQVHLEQVQSALPHMAEKAVIIFDDTFRLSKNKFWGKGAMAIPYLLKKTNFRIKKIGAEGFLLANFSCRKK